MKKSSVSQLIEIKEKCKLCDIWRIRNTEKKRFIFRQKHRSSFLQRRLEYLFVSNTLLESIKRTKILPALSPLQFYFLYLVPNLHRREKGYGSLIIRFS